MLKKSKRQIVIIFLCVFVFSWMAVIFHFSTQNGDQSSAVSEGVVTNIARTVVPDFDTLEAAQRAKIIDEWHTTVRKTAHFCSFLVLGMLVTCGFISFRMKLGRAMVYAGIFCFIYAASDEIHQIFISGRSPGIRDVLIDTAGALTGILSVIIVVTAIWCIRENRESASVVD